MGELIWVDSNNCPQSCGGWVIGYACVSKGLQRSLVV